MNGEQFLKAINDADDVYINESLPGISLNNAGTTRRRGLRIALIAACLVVVLGVVAYAAGWFTKPFEVVNEGITIKDDKGNETAGSAVTVLLDALDPEEIRGSFRDDALEMQADSMGYIQLYREFPNVNDAVEYIGCDKLDAPYFPNDIPSVVFFNGKQDLSLGSPIIQSMGNIDDIGINSIIQFFFQDGNLSFDLSMYNEKGDFVGNAEVTDSRTRYRPSM